MAGIFRRLNCAFLAKTGEHSLLYPVEVEQA
jgi:hypothetical protein